MRLRWPRSLIARILLVELATIVLALVALPPITIVMLNGESRRYQNETLLAQAETVAEALTPDDRGGWRVDLEPAMRSIFETGYDGRAYFIFDRAGRKVAASAAGLRRPIAMPRGATAMTFRSHHIVGVSLPVGPGPSLWIVVTQDLRRPGVILDDVVRAFLVRYLAVLLPLLLLLPIINTLVARRLVSAVRAVSQRAAAIDVRSLDVRLDEAGLPAEIVPLVHATNDLVDRLGASFRQQLQFSANVAHELRTPLATLRLQAEGVSDAALRAQLVRQTERLSHVLSQLRDLAALETALDPGAMERVDLQALARRVVGEMAPEIFARDHPIVLAGGAAPILVRGKAVLIETALRNLIDNAARHTPAGVHIEVATGADGSVAVSDDGPGIVTDQLDRLVQRFWRADHRRSDSAGIGLSIVRRIVDVHGGVLDIVNREPHGARFAARFPLA